MTFAPPYIYANCFTYFTVLAWQVCVPLLVALGQRDWAATQLKEWVVGGARKAAWAAVAILTNRKAQCVSMMAAAAAMVTKEESESFKEKQVFSFAYRVSCLRSPFDASAWHRRQSLGPLWFWHNSIQRLHNMRFAKKRPWFFHIVLLRFQK